MRAAVIVTSTLALTGIAAPWAHAAAPGWRQTGIATWYGRDEAGRRTSSGVRFDPQAMTAAHPSLPLGTRVVVTDAENGRTVMVTINDREPRHGDRIIDLSEAAAARLGMLGAGRATVQIAPAGAADDAVEVADAGDDVTGTQPLDSAETRAPRRHLARHVTLSRSRYGRRRMHHAAR